MILVSLENVKKCVLGGGTITSKTEINFFEIFSHSAGLFGSAPFEKFQKMLILAFEANNVPAKMRPKLWKSHIAIHSVYVYIHLSILIMLSLTLQFPCVSCFPSSHSASIMWLGYIFVTNKYIFSTPNNGTQIKVKNMSMHQKHVGIYLNWLPAFLLAIIVTRCQSPKYENGFKHLWHLALSNVWKTNDENLWFFLFG